MKNREEYKKLRQTLFHAVPIEYKNLISLNFCKKVKKKSRVDASKRSKTVLILLLYP